MPQLSTTVNMYVEVLQHVFHKNKMRWGLMKGAYVIYPYKKKVMLAW
jgi:hypothetical protein